MAPPSPKEFIETALFATNPYALSYSDSEQKWLILRHLLSLLQEYPSFRPSTGRFLHNDGNEVNLLCASGYVHVSNSTPSIPLTIWLHENYPHKAPLVFVSLDPMTRIHRHHPFVDTSGATTPPYILTWKYPPCNLSDLLHNLVQLFSHDHPFSYSPPTIEEIEELSLLQDNLKKRDRFTTSMILEMEQEWKKLKERSNNWAEEADRLVNWLKVNDRRPLMALAAGDVEIEDAFEIDEKSRVKLDCSAADSAIEDVLYKLDKALELEAVSFDSYIKQVRSLAREQFFLRASEMKLNGLDIPH
ncbi:Ubiquitin E2 variant [Theobroma cacao]|nr:Ubiquitin E2 variant [Theobroma cacao]